MHITTADIEDDLGPSKILWVREQRIGLEAVVVIDNVACGPAIGGIRMASDITAAEIVRLARSMTLRTQLRAFLMEAEMPALSQILRSQALRRRDSCGHAHMLFANSPNTSPVPIWD